MKDNIIIIIDKNKPNNIIRNQNNQTYTISKDSGETWQTVFAHNLSLHNKKEMEIEKYTELINLLKKKRKIEKEWQSVDNKLYSNEAFINTVYELKYIDRKINKIIDLL
ncbi:MAG TPA: hypothetical protein GX530_06930 [Corynebacteriales bacterium]|nr:hypothetical protein [Mycobacteriales bacterium]